MGAQQLQQQQQHQQQQPQHARPVCEGFLEKKKSSERRIPIGPSWKRRYCMLSTDGLRLYGSKQEYMCGAGELRIIPMCHIKCVRQVSRSDEAITGDRTLQYFDVETERGDTTSLRFRDRVAWPALIQIELIKYKVRVF